MSVSFENKETNRGVLTFTISQDQIKPELDRVFNSVKKSLNVPGFRKGHLPRPIFDKKFGEESLYQDVMNALLPNAYEAAVKEAGLEVVAQPKIDVTSMEKGQDWVITAEVVTKPEVKLGDYKNQMCIRDRVKACNAYFKLGLTRSQLAQEAKFASGSSSRSFYGPLGAWDKDSGEIYPVETDLKLAMIMLVLEDKKKPISSRDGMKLCVETSTTFDDWVRQSEKDYQDMLVYLKENDFAKVGELTEENALAMHATTKTASPAFSYLTDASYEAMDFVRQLREQGEACYFTMDAGPNVKVLCQEKDLEHLSEIFGQRYRLIVSKTKDLSQDDCC